MIAQSHPLYLGAFGNVLIVVELLAIAFVIWGPPR